MWAPSVGILTKLARAGPILASRISCKDKNFLQSQEILVFPRFSWFSKNILTTDVKLLNKTFQYLFLYLSYFDDHNSYLENCDVAPKGTFHFFSHPTWFLIDHWLSLVQTCQSLFQLVAITSEYNWAVTLPWKWPACNFIMTIVFDTVLRLRSWGQCLKSIATVASLIVSSMS